MYIDILCQYRNHRLNANAQIRCMLFCLIFFLLLRRVLCLLWLLFYDDFNKKKSALLRRFWRQIDAITSLTHRHTQTHSRSHVKWTSLFRNYFCCCCWFVGWKLTNLFAAVVVKIVFFLTLCDSSMLSLFTARILGYFSAPWKKEEWNIWFRVFMAFWWQFADNKCKQRFNKMTSDLSIHRFGNFFFFCGGGGGIIRDE